jgi:hypothetical protein
MIRRLLVACANWVYRHYGVTIALLSEALTEARDRADQAEHALATQGAVLQELREVSMGQTERVLALEHYEREAARLSEVVESKASAIEALRFKLAALDRVRPLITAAGPVLTALDAIQDPVSSEWKHATAFGRLVKAHPQASRRDIGLAIELALRGL